MEAEPEIDWQKLNDYCYAALTLQEIEIEYWLAQRQPSRLKRFGRRMLDKFWEAMEADGKIYVDPETDPAATPPL